MVASSFLRQGIKITSYVTAGFIGGYSLIVTNCATPFEAPPVYNLNSGQKWDYNWDKREPYSLRKPPKNTEDSQNQNTPPPKPTATRHIYLIRHGQYEIDQEDDCKRRLTIIGKQQACCTGRRLKELCVKFTNFYVSNMTRALETADAIQRELGTCPFEIDPLLREGPPIAPDPPVPHWNPEQHEFFAEGPRIEAAFRKYFHRADTEQCEDSHEIIVCHANVIRYFVCRALQFPSEGWLRLTLNNGSITRISISPTGRVVLRSVSEAGYMSPDILTYT